LPDKKIASLEELFDVLEKLEIDEGVRVRGKIGSKRCYIFITKSAVGYTLAVFETPNSGGVGKQLMIRDSVSLERVKDFVAKNCEMPLTAHRY